MQIRLSPKIAQTALTVAMVSILAGLASAQAPAPGFWSLTGNAGTNSANDFLGTKDNQPLAIRTNGAERVRVDTNGNVGIGTTSPSAKLNIDPKGPGGIVVGDPNTGSGGFTSLLMDISAATDGFGRIQAIKSSGSAWGDVALNPLGGNVGVGTTTVFHMLQVGGGYDGNLGFDGSDGTPNAGYIRFGDNTGWKLHFTRQREQGGGAPLNTGTTGALMTIQDNGNVGIGTMNPQAPLDVAGMTRTSVLQITGGSDLAEPFEASETIKPGMVVAIDPERPGRLRIADKAYDHTVAGIVSGANGINPGLTMGQQGTAADGSLPVALTGRVYCWADASNGPINPGDLLTSSSTPGHAMKVTNHAKAHGATIGKAMTKLGQGKGLVLVLVALQ
jgi:hypothetical protein